MRVGLLSLLVLAIACGDDDVSTTGDSGFTIRDASLGTECVPYFLSNADRDLDAGDTMGGRDAGTMDAGHDAGALSLMCDMPGLPDSECANIEWTFAGGEHISLAGCCVPAGTCGGLDPTGLAGCIGREVFGLSVTTCTPSANLDAGDDDGGDNEASVPAT